MTAPSIAPAASRSPKQFEADFAYFVELFSRDTSGFVKHAEILKDIINSVEWTNAVAAQMAPAVAQFFHSVENDIVFEYFYKKIAHKRENIAIIGAINGVCGKRFVKNYVATDASHALQFSRVFQNAASLAGSSMHGDQYNIATAVKFQKALFELEWIKDKVCVELFADFCSKLDAASLIFIYGFILADLEEKPQNWLCDRIQSIMKEALNKK